MSPKILLNAFTLCMYFDLIYDELSSKHTFPLESIEKLTMSITNQVLCSLKLVSNDQGRHFDRLVRPRTLVSKF